MWSFVVSTVLAGIASAATAQDFRVSDENCCLSENIANGQNLEVISQIANISDKRAYVNCQYRSGAGGLPDGLDRFALSVRCPEGYFYRSHGFGVTLSESSLSELAPYINNPNPQRAGGDETFVTWRATGQDTLAVSPFSICRVDK